MNKAGEAFENAYKPAIGKIGEADARLMMQRDIVDFSILWIEKNRQ